MSLISFSIQSFRNINDAQLALSPSFNLFSGDNGSGKTSVLEAIHYLGLGRSFRTHLANRVIQYEQSEFTVFGQVAKHDSELPISAGLSKSKGGDTQIRIQGARAKTVSELAQLLPLQFINHESHQLLDSGPKYRRQYMDWLLFHVEPQFFSAWQDLQRLLKQRNTAIRQQRSDAEITAWDQALIDVAHTLTAFRAESIQALTPYVVDLLKHFLDDTECHFEGLTCHYFPGWARDRDYATVLAESLEKDRQLGYTYYGPQRADWVMRLDGVPIHDVLSRGQQKLFLCALLLAQGHLLRAESGKVCVYLLDDLPAELDIHKQRKLVSALQALDAQVLITGVDLSGIAAHLHEQTASTNAGLEAASPASSVATQLSAEVKMFHVERGQIQAL